jgi:transglutaminase-like putative cysteine protease/uncharacterized membrane protein
VESLEARLMLDASPNGLPPSIVVGRTLSSYFFGGVQNGRETITYTVYNEQADDETGVLLTTTLNPGVSYVDASIAPDRSGPGLAWSLGTIPGYGRASVTLTVALNSTNPLQLDSGAHAYATLEGGVVSDAAPSAMLRAGTLADPTLLASTADANTTDPYIQEQAARLDYDPQAIFDYLREDVGYNSYLGSVRGARGTLWSSAGNALDVASLGIALMRASGIPAQYVAGTLSTAQAQDLILSMFPASYQAVGYIPAGTATADPANDPRLLSDTESHYWFRFDPGSGMQDADPLMAGATVGHAFTAPTGTFSEVADSLRAKTEVQLVAETYSQASALFGLSGLSTSVVLDQTFNDVDLVGRTLTFGNLVTTTGLSALITYVTNIYTPFLVVDDIAQPDSSQDTVITGTPYQEVKTNFPLGSQILTGLFLNVDTTAEAGTTQKYTETLADRIGIAARQNGGSSPISDSPGSAPLVTPFDLTTISVLAGQFPVNALGAANAKLDQLSADLAQLGSLAATLSQASQADQDALAPQATDLLRDVMIGMARFRLAQFLTSSSFYSDLYAANMHVSAYFDSPRIAVFRSKLAPAADGSVGLDIAFDILKNNIRTVVAPGENAAEGIAFNMVRGPMDTGIETSVNSAPSDLQGISLTTGISAQTIFAAAQAQGISTTILLPSDIAILDTLNLSADAKALITVTLARGDIVVVPSESVQIDGQARSAWYEIDPSTGETIGVLDNGDHGAESAASRLFGFVVLQSTNFVLGLLAGATVNSVLGVVKTLVILGASKKLIPPNISNNPAFQKGTALLALAGLYKFVQANEQIFLLRLQFNAFRLGLAISLAWGLKALLQDPPVPEAEFDSAPSGIPPSSAYQASKTESASLVGGAVQGNVRTPNVQISGTIQAAWSSTSVVNFAATSLNTQGATVRDAEGNVLGNGTVVLTSGTAISAAVAGTGSYNVSGQGSLSAYGPAGSSLGVGGDWSSYTATVSGSLTIAITSGGLTLNGIALPAGTYTITAGSATLTGSGAMTSPNFSGSVAISATAATIELGTGSGTLSVGGKPLEPGNGTTLTGYSGTVGVSANGDGTDSVAIDGVAGDVLRVAAGSSALTADQNTAVIFQPIVATSFADSYTLTAQAPAGWTVSIDADGNVTSMPPPGTQGGTYAIQIVAQSTTNPNLVAQSTVDVTVIPTEPGITLAIDPDPVFTIPVNGAELPTAYRASIRNLGPAADTFLLTSANVPAGFSLVQNRTSIAIPAGVTGIVGLYLVPAPGQALPAPGTVLTFDVIATSTSDPSITKTVTITFTVPAIDAISLTGAPAAVNTTPGAGTTDTITIANVGNVAETITLSSSTSAGLGLAGLSTVTLQPGESTTQIITLTPGAAIALNSHLRATITASYGISGATTTLSLPVNIVVPGASAIADAADAAGQLGRADLTARLDDLSVALTNLVQDPASAVYKGQATAALGTVIGLLGADPALASIIPALQADSALLNQAATAADVQAAVSTLGNDLGTVGSVLSAEANNPFSFSFLANSQVGRPQLATTYQLFLQNTGNQTTTYDLVLGPLPAGVTGTLSQSTITLEPGQVTPGSGVPTLIVTITSTSTTELSPFSFTVSASPQGVPQVSQTITGQFTVRQNFVQVTSVATDPAFTNPGGQVEVSARILNAVNKQQDALVSYTVKDAGGTVIFTSPAVSATLNVLATLTDVDLGNLDTTGFALGQDTITVTVTDPSGTVLAMGSGSILIGTPVSATLTTTPTTVPSGTSTVTTTLQVDSQTTLVGPLGVVSQTSQPDAVGVAQSGHFVYVGGTSGISAYDITDPANPQFIRTFGSSATLLEVHDNQLYALQRGGAAGRFFLRIYSLTDPTNPALLGSATYSDGQEGIPYGNPWHMVVTDTDVFVSCWGFTYLQPNDIKYQLGDVIAIDVSDPTTPHFVSSLKNTYGTNSDGIGQYLNVDNFGGEGPTWEIVQVDANTLLVAGSTVAGDDTETGNGVVEVIDISDPANMTVVRSLVIPGTVQAVGISVEGDRALVTGSTTGWQDLGSLDFTGDTVLAVLDISDPRNPALLGTQTLDRSSRGPYAQFTAPLGNGQFVFSSLNQTTDTEDPSLFVVDISNPQGITFSSTDIPDATTHLAASGNFVYTTSSDGLIIYQIDAPDSIPTTAQVTIPAGVTIVDGSFSLDPTSTIENPDGSHTLAWDLSLSAGELSRTITWQSTVTGIQPGQSEVVAQGASVAFTSEETPATLALPDQVIAGQQIIGIDPATQSIAPGASAPYTITLANPTAAPVTYTLSVQGVDARWVGLPASVDVAANGSATVSLVLSPGAAAILGDYGFSITAVGDNGAIGSVQADLVLQGLPVQPDPQSHGIVVSITPTQATAGQGTSARYTVRLTNTGSASEAFHFTISGLPSGVTPTFSESELMVPPGASNYRDVTLILTAEAGTNPGASIFSVTATSDADSTISSSASASLSVNAAGVSVVLTPPSGNPGDGYQATVTNTGTTTDTFDLALSGLGSLVATLGVTQVTLAPGASQVVSIATNAVNFALSGSLGLTVSATSHIDPAVIAADSAALAIAPTAGMTTGFNPATVTLSAPGMATFQLTVHNTGNTEDAYEVTIIGTNGPISAFLVGLDGGATQSIASFRLPALSNGVLTLMADLSAVGQGTVTVRVRSLTDGTIAASAIATVGAAVTPTPTPTPTSTPTPTPTSTPTTVPSAMPGPEVTKVVRYGIHMSPTTIVLSFSEQLDPATAQNVRNYRLIGPDGHRIRIKSAVYDPSAMKVTLHPSQRVSIHHPYRLVVNGASSNGVMATNGLHLVGSKNGLPGSNFKTVLSWRNLGTPVPARFRHPRAPKRAHHALPKAYHPAMKPSERSFKLSHNVKSDQRP